MVEHVVPKLHRDGHCVELADDAGLVERDGVELRQD